MLLRQLSCEGTGGAKGGNLCFFNDDLHREQIQTELEMLGSTLLNSLSCTGRRRELFGSTKDPPLLKHKRVQQ